MNTVNTNRTHAISSISCNQWSVRLWAYSSSCEFCTAAVELCCTHSARARCLAARQNCHLRRVW